MALIRHRGRINVSPRLLMEWLQLDGGKVIHGEFDHERGVVTLIVDHPEMPIWQEGMTPELVTLAYTTTWDGRETTVTRDPIRS